MAESSLTTDSNKENKSRGERLLNRLLTIWVILGAVAIMILVMLLIIPKEAILKAADVMNLRYRIRIERIY